MLTILDSDGIYDNGFVCVCIQVIAKQRRAAIYKVSFFLRFSKAVTISLYNRKDNNVDTSDVSTLK